MKLNRIITLCAIATTLAMSAGSLFAQDNGNDNGGGQRRNRGGGFGGGNFDPAQFQQRMMDNIRDQLNFTNDTDWSAVQPLVQKVMDARRDVGGGGMGRMFGAQPRRTKWRTRRRTRRHVRPAQPGTGSVAEGAGR